MFAVGVTQYRLAVGPNGTRVWCTSIRRHEFVLFGRLWGQIWVVGLQRMRALLKLSMRGQPETLTHSRLVKRTGRSYVCRNVSLLT